MEVQAKCHIRWMIRRDMPEVLRIEEDSFGPHAFTEDDFLRELRNRNVIGLVAVTPDESRILGYIVYEMNLRHLKITNLAVAEDVRFEGIGRALIDKIIGKLSLDRRTQIQVNVRESNLGALLFFKQCGFLATGLVQDAYFDCDDDAVAMQYRINGGLAGE